MLARSCFELGEFGKAAAAYASLGDTDTVLSRVNRAKLDPWTLGTDLIDRQDLHQRMDFKPRIYFSIVRSAQLGHDLERAQDVLRQWAHEYPNHPGIFLLMADIQAIEGKYEEAYQSLRRELDLNPSLEEDLGARIALALGAVPARSNDILAKIEKVLNQVPQVSRLIDGLLTTHWPPFARLSPASRKEWRTAVSLAHYFAFLEPEQADSMREAASQAFAKAVEVEFRARVFGIFRVEFRRSSELQLLARQNESTPETGVFCDYFRTGKLTLGSMLLIIDYCRSLTAPPLLQKFKSWLHRSHPILLVRIDAFWKVGPLRNLAVHDIIAPQDLEEIPRLCRQIMEAMHPGKGQTAGSESA